MILNRQNLSENNWNHFKIVPQGHNNCQLSIVNCQFGEAAKFQFAGLLRKSHMHIPFHHRFLTQPPCQTKSIRNPPPTRSLFSEKTEISYLRMKQNVVEYSLDIDYLRQRKGVGQ